MAGLMEIRLLKSTLLAGLILIGTNAFTQEQDIAKDSTRVFKPTVTLTDFAHKTFGNWEQHSDFTIKYSLDPQLSLELQGFFDTYIFEDVFKAPFIGRKYISKKLNVFSGVEVEARRLLFKNNSWTPPLLKTKNGIGYDINTNFQLQLEHDMQFNNARPGAYSFPKLLSFRGKLKF